MKRLNQGEIKESELMQEASELMAKMKGIPGVKNMERVYSNKWVCPECIIWVV